MRSPVWPDGRRNEGGGSMANYAIMRCKKLTGMGSVASALQHCYRSVRRRMLTLNGHQKTTALYPNQRIRQWGVSGSCCLKTP